jgi:MFS family permease
MTSPRPLIILLCVMTGAHTFTVGTFPALLPEIAVALRLPDWQLGLLAGSFGLARMASDIPGGLLMTHHVRRALIAAPMFMFSGVAFVITGGELGWLVLGRVLMGVGHMLGMLGGLTVILRYQARGGMASALNAFEFSAMLAVLGGVTLVGLLPRTLPWNLAFLLGSAPMLLGVSLLPRVLARLPPTDPGRPWFARATLAEPTEDSGRDDLARAALAFAAGGTVAVTYATVESFLIPIRGSREFGLERPGVARLFMLAQTADLLALLPLGALADRRGTARVLAGVLVAFAVAIALIGLGALPHVVAGCVVYGFGMAGWMLPLGLLRAATPASRVAWRAALYRVCVDGGMFLGPFLSGLVAARFPWLLPSMLAVALALLAVALATRGTPRSAHR